LQHSFKILYFDLLPPSPFLREANKVIACLAFILIVLAFGWSFNIFPRDPLLGVVNDVVILGATLVEIWYLSLFVSSMWRVREYRRAAPQLPYQIFQVLYPWAGLLIVNSTILTICIAQRVYNSSNSPASNALGIGRSLYKILLAELAPLIALEVPIIKNWLPRFEPMRFVNIFQKSLSVMIGREIGTDVYEHATAIVEFQVEFTKYMDENADIREKTNILPYYDAKALSEFQRTLSCLYETSRELGKHLDALFEGRVWSLLDVGGGEGIFTCELLAGMKSIPNLASVIDPAEANIEAYRERMANKFPLIRNVDACVGTIETMIDELPIFNCVLASHSLYAAFDHSRKRAASLIAQLIDKSRSGCAVFIMASRDSYLYTIKKMVLADLHHIDRSSFGEDLCEALPVGRPYSAHTFDSVVDVTALLDEYEALIGWLAYFCRVDRSELRPHFDMCQALVRDTAIDLRCLPRTEYQRLKDTGIAAKMKLTDESKIIYHKEVVIIVPSLEVTS
jgi:hypothetical protein